MATYKGTAAVDGAQPKYLHTGQIAVKSTYTFTATASIGDVIQMVKVPRGAIIDQIVIYGDGADHVTVGDGGNAARFIASSSVLTAMHHLLKEGVSTAIGYQYDISDDAAVAYDTIDATVVVANSSLTDVMTMLTYYHCDG